MGRIAGKVVIITGGGSGIGKATAKKLAMEGGSVVVTDLNAKAGQETIDEIGDSACFFSHDVAEESDWERVINQTVGRLGRVDILVNNAGILRAGGPQNPEDLMLDEVHAVSKVNVDGVLLGCKHAIKAMKDHGGAIINISSIAGIYGVPRLVAYGASKGAVRQLTKSMAVYCGNKGYQIRCNSIHPGVIETSMGDDMFGFAFDDPEQARQERRERIPMGRIGRPEDIANAVCYLASDEASYVNGIELVVDGGHLIT